MLREAAKLCYDPAGNLTNVNYPGTFMDIALQYDTLERLTDVVDALGTTEFGYTAAGQLQSEDGPWASDTVSYTYQSRQRNGLSLLQPNASAWTQSYGHDSQWRLTNVTSQAGSFGCQYRTAISDLRSALTLPGGSAITNDFDGVGRLLETVLRNGHGTRLNSHAYALNNGHQRTRQTFTEGNYVDYGYDKIGQLQTAKGWESGGSTARLNEQFGYDYDAAWNLNHRTNNALVQTFGVNNRNELTSATHSGTLTVAGTTTSAATNVTVNSLAAEIYGDHTFAKAGFTVTNGLNSFTAVARDDYGRVDTNTVSVNLPATNTFAYDQNGNLTNDGSRVFEYDYENQLTAVLVEDEWKSEFAYDAFGRRRVRKEYSWSGSAWTLTEEVRYVYDGMLVIQERDGSNVPQVTYTRGTDLSGSLQQAGGIGGLLARTDHTETRSHLATAFYHADGNGNITALVNTNGLVVAKYHYDPYGNTLSASGPMAEANLYRFSSKEWHANAGLYYYGYRYYEPNLQRWLNRDPIGEQGGINLYGFVAADPTSNVNSFGLRDCPFWAEYMSNHPDELQQFRDDLDELILDLFDWIGDRLDPAFRNYDHNAKGVNAVKENFELANEALFGMWAPTGTGMLASGATAKAFGTITPLQWALGRSIPGATSFTTAETATLVGSTWVMNAVFVAGTWEAGLLIGSAAEAAFPNVAYDLVEPYFPVGCDDE